MTLQPTNIAHRFCEAGNAEKAINPQIGNAGSVTVACVLVRPTPEPVELADDRIFVQSCTGGYTNDGRIVVQVNSHLNPVAGHDSLTKENPALSAVLGRNEALPGLAASGQPRERGFALR